MPDSPEYAPVLPRTATLARLRPNLRAQHPSIDPDEWYPVLASNPSSLEPKPRPGLVWIEVRGRPRQLPVSILQFDPRRPTPRGGAFRDPCAPPAAGGPAGAPSTRDRYRQVTGGLP